MLELSGIVVATVCFLLLSYADITDKAVLIEWTCLDSRVKRITRIGVDGDSRVQVGTWKGRRPVL